MKIRELFTKYFDFIETFFLGGFVVGLMLLLREITYAHWVVKVSLIGLSFLYWTKALGRDDSLDALTKWSSKVMWYSLIITPPAIIAKLSLYENADTFLIISLLLLAVAFVLMIITTLKNKKKLFTIIFFRLLIAIILVFWLFTLPLPKF